MQNQATSTDKIRSFLVLAATIGMIVFNWLAATGGLNGIQTGDISDKYPTPVTPSGYAFSIWTLIYIGLIAFSIYQLLPANLARFRSVRSLYILSCALNCAWLYFWHGDQIVICFAIIAALWVVLFFICYLLRKSASTKEFWLAKSPFGLYFGWITAATLVNLAVMLVYLKIEISTFAWSFIGVGLILFAAALGVLMRYRLINYLYPLAIAWALTAIGVKQSGQTLIVSAAAVGTIACLIAAVSFVMDLPYTGKPAKE